MFNKQNFKSSYTDYTSQPLEMSENNIPGKKK